MQQSFSKPPSYADILNHVPKFKYLLWDMDGTIMQTEPLHTRATMEIIKNFHPEATISYEEVDKLCIGATDGKSLEVVQGLGLLTSLGKAKFIQLKTESIAKQVERGNLTEFILPEIRQLLEEIKLKGHTQVIVTSSERELTDILVEKLQVKKYMDFILTREDTAENKPLPMPYLTAVEKLGATKDQCLILEDSPTGLAAAQASGIKYFQAKWY